MAVAPLDDSQRITALLEAARLDAPESRRADILAMHGFYVSMTESFSHIDLDGTEPAIGYAALRATEAVETVE